MQTETLMLRFLLLISLLLSSTFCFSQGYVNFSNRVLASGVDAPVTFEDGRLVGATDGFVAQLYAGEPGTPISSFQPAFPVTTFRPNNAGYVLPVEAEVRQILAGYPAEVVMRVFNGPSWEESTYRGESNPVRVVLALITQLPPDLNGLSGFNVTLVPEPRAWLVAVMGMGVWIVLKRKGW